MLESSRRVAIVAGLRTPFAKRGTAFQSMTALDLGQLVVAELVRRAQVPPKDIDRVVFGQVMPSLRGHNVARDIVVGASLPWSIDAHSVSRACATAYQAVASVGESIQLGAIDCGVAGGAESASDVPIGVSPRLRDALVRAGGAKSLRKRVGIFARLRWRDLRPEPMMLKELSTGETMGESAERLAKANDISRQSQDDYAHRSHVRAAQAWSEGRFADQVMTVFVPPHYAPISSDNLVRRDSDRSEYSRLKPVFDPAHGTITAGNASPLTDGAAALLLMSEQAARDRGIKPLGYLGPVAFAGCDPSEQLLMGPAFAIPKLLQATRWGLDDFDLIDLHEAFAAQVLSNVRALESTAFAQQYFGKSDRVGRVDFDKLNLSGGSLAIGHPFAATGARQILQTLHDLVRTGGQRALCATCAAGGLGAALVLEAP